MRFMLYVNRPAYVHLGEQHEDERLDEADERSQNHYQRVQDDGENYQHLPYQLLRPAELQHQRHQDEKQYLLRYYVPE